jgi:replication factor C subunit 2/4
MDAVLGQPQAVEFLRSRLMTPPHLILWGPTGTGKTMLATAWVAEQLAAQGITDSATQATMTLWLSSADDRGITAIRQRLSEFVRRRRAATGWLIVDDADNLPVVTQQALRRILELNADQTRFCFIAQSPEHFIEPLQSRCVLVQLHPVGLHTHAAALAARHAPDTILTEESLRLIASICIGNARQFSIICQSLPAGTVSSQEIQLLINAPPVTLLQRLQKACVARDITAVTECCLALWSRGSSFEDCVAMLEMVVRIYSAAMTPAEQYVLQCCAEGHIHQILNRTTLLDLIAVLSGQRSSGCMA